MTSKTVRLATRGSQLARAQTDLVSAALLQATGLVTEVVVIETKGDRDQSIPVQQLSGQGWFTAELERVLLSGEVDGAVHSAKDLPNELATGLTIAAYLPRADVCDAFISRDGSTLASLPPGSVVGTSSPRREAMALAANESISLAPMRGNVDTRLAKLDRGEVDGLLLACAGLDRIGRGERITQRLDAREFIPAPAQGAIAIEVATDSSAAEEFAHIDDAETRSAVTAERAVLAGLGGGCLLPLGAWARIEQGRLVLSAALSVDGVLRRAEKTGDIDNPKALGGAVAAALR